MSSITLSPKQEHYTLLAAERFGGSFTRFLAQAGIFADSENRRRIFSAFPEIAYKYGPQSRFYDEQQ